MSSSLVLHHARHLSSAAVAAATGASTASSAISISKAKAKLRSEFDPDKALEIYSSVSDHYTSPVSSRYAQDLTIKRLAKSRRFADIETLIEGQINDPKIIQEPYLSTLIRSYGVAGMFDHALRMYNQMDELRTPRSAISFNALLSACNRSRLFNRVPQLFEEIPQSHGISPDKVSYSVLVKSYCESGSPESAIAIMKEMEAKGIEITVVTYTTVLDALYKQGKSDEAERIWNDMVKKGCSPDVAAYNVRLMHAHDGDPENVKGLIEEMSNAGLKPDAISYNYLMTCYCKRGMMDEAKKVYEGFKENGCKPKATTFRTWIYYLCKTGDFEQGYKVFKESVKVHKVPDFNTLKHLARGLVEKSKMKEAKGMLRTVKKKFPANFLHAWGKLEEELGLASAPSEAGETQ
ncbi:pentatricopeptide repeat-containing protein At4g36680, mitochondrial [Diospyros lotus]|uniref:pentatricopeptide repeat-containing protein At4g36680, mitochondrial n=1 Tax=Diospyros lotus TaxID=55363 RepID=UPI00225C0977|nr:pentatricopeptide repeat-containing protein At4g36680, mitochondrial [Diospyros lotus]